MKTSSAIAKIIQSARDSRDTDGVAWISATDVAKLIKARLAKEFPGVKFSVRTPHHGSIYVSWDGFPMQGDVEAIIESYEFGGFDGSIDMAYSSDCWLLPDGRIVPAACNGTKGQRGCVPEFSTDCPQPGAVLVRGGAKYISASQHIPCSVWAAAVVSVDPSLSVEDVLGRGWSNVMVNGEDSYRHSGVRACVEKTLTDEFNNSRNSD